METTTSQKRPVRILSLDGGGVRGLSSLIVLERLLFLVNQQLKDHFGEANHRDLLPTELFDHVVGTSAGGLIAIMIVKLSMPMADCIRSYKDLASKIFASKQFGSFLGGLGRPRYSHQVVEDCVQTLIDKYGKQKSGGYVKHMEDENAGGHKTTCSVVCREYSQSGRRLGDPAFLCSHNCRPGQVLTPGEGLVDLRKAARATSAAPTYFARTEINGRILIDGAFGNTNNPTRKAHFHLSAKEPEYHRSPVLWVNIGTGSPRARESDRGRRSSAASIIRDRVRDRFLPSVLHETKALLQDLENIATNADRVEDEMEDIISSKSNTQHISFHRMSANNGVAEIPLDDWRQLDRIEKLTRDYLNTSEIQQKSLRMAKQLARAIKAEREPPVPFPELRATSLEERGRFLTPSPQPSFRSTRSRASTRSAYESGSPRRLPPDACSVSSRRTGRATSDPVPHVALPAIDISTNYSPNPPRRSSDRLSVRSSRTEQSSATSSRANSTHGRAELVVTVNASTGLTVPNPGREKRYSNASVYSLDRRMSVVV